MTGFFEGKVAIVTGAGAGIGKAIARQLGEAGAKVVVSDMNAQTARKVADEIVAAGGAAEPFQLDVTDPKAVEESVRFAEETYGRLDLAVNNAGITGGIAPFAEHPIEDWRRTIDVNLNGVFYGLKYQLGSMLKTGGGAIVNMASILGSVAAPNVPGYIASKHAVVGLTKTAALDYARNNIRVNSVGPGYIDTDMMASLDAEGRKVFEELHPVGRLGRADEVANLVLFLLSDKASFITGSYHTVDGGFASV